MSESSLSGPPAKTSDPVLKFLGGCALVAGGLAAIVILVGGLATWRLIKDDNPGRAEEIFVAGDETRYWCLELNPNDAGLAALVDNLNRSARAMRERAADDTGLPRWMIRGRDARLDALLPMKLEFAASPDGETSHASWAGRATLSKGLFRARATIKLMRWILTRNPESGRSVDVDGVEVTILRDHGNDRMALATVGDRILGARDSSRLEAMLRPQGKEGVPRGVPAGAARLHERLARPGDDGWAYALDTEVSGAKVPVVAASFDVDPSGDLVWRAAAVLPRDAALSAEQAEALARGLVPEAVRDAVAMDDGSIAREGDVVTWAGRIPDLAGQLRGWVGTFSGRTETPSAIPTPPSRRKTSDPRSGTREESPHAGTPTPAR